MTPRFKLKRHVCNRTTRIWHFNVIFARIARWVMVLMIDCLVLDVLFHIFHTYSIREQVQQYINIIQIWNRNGTTKATTFDHHSSMGNLVWTTNVVISSSYNAPTLFRNLQMRSFMYEESILKTWHPNSPWLGFPYYDVIGTASPIPHMGTWWTAHWVDTWRRSFDLFFLRYLLGPKSSNSYNFHKKFHNFKTNI